MIDLHGPKAFIFDLDGTLVDSEKYHVRALAATLRDLAGYEMTVADIEAYKGNTCRDMAIQLVREHGWKLDIDLLVKRKFELLDEIFVSDPFPGVAEFLAFWRGRTRFAVASNSPETFVRGVLRDLGILDAVEVLCTVSDVKRRKPDPEMLHLVLSRLGLTASEVLVFEDSGPGIQAAVAAHCTVVVMDTPAAIQAGPPPPGLATATWPKLVAASRISAGGGGSLC